MSTKQTPLKSVTIRFDSTEEGRLLREFLLASSQEGGSAAKRMTHLAYVGYLTLQRVLKEPVIPSSVRMEGKKSARPRSSPEDGCAARQDGEREKKSVSDIGWVDEIMGEEESLPTPKESLPDKRSENDEKQDVLKSRLANMFPGF